MTDGAKTAVLLMAYGTPRTMDDIEPYYTHIRRGRPPSTELLAELKERYEVVGGHTPLNEITSETGRKLERRLQDRGARYPVYIGMKHWHPYIRQAVGEMDRGGVSRVVGLVLAPHYSVRSIAEYYGYIDRAQEEIGSRIEVERIVSWHLHQPYLDAVARRVRARLAEFPDPGSVTVLFTAHSLPERILELGDPYQDQLLETAAALTQMLNLRHWTFSFQSAGRTPDPWLGPDILDKVRELAAQGVTDVLVAPIGFVSDHLEIFYDIDYEAQNVASACGVTLRRTESLNAGDDFIEGLADLVLEKAPPVRPS